MRNALLHGYWEARYASPQRDRRTCGKPTTVSSLQGSSLSDRARCGQRGGRRRAVCMGPGLRWALMGPNLIYHLGGGGGGIHHFFEQFAGPMTAGWPNLGSPDLNPELQKKIADGVMEEVDGRS